MPCCLGGARAAAFRPLVGLKLLLRSTLKRALVKCRRFGVAKKVAFCRETPDVCEAKRPFTYLHTHASVADGQFQAQRGPFACVGFWPLLSLRARVPAFSAINAYTDGGRRLGHRQQARAELCQTTPHGIGRNHLNTAVRAKAVDKAAAKRARRDSHGIG